MKKLAEYVPRSSLTVYIMILRVLLPTTLQILLSIFRHTVFYNKNTIQKYGNWVGTSTIANINYTNFYLYEKRKSEKK